MRKDTRMHANDVALASPERTGRRWIAPLVGGLVIAGVAALALWLVVLRPSVSTQAYQRPNPPVVPPLAYYQAVEGQIAQGLGLSVAQVKAAIHADPGEGLFGVATARGISPDQLYQIEIAAHQAAGAQMVAGGIWTQQQADATTQYWQGRGAKALGSDMTNWFLSH
jgi:hypothetical protein